MIDYLRSLIGTVPLGYNFLEYIFSFILVLFGLFLVYKFIEAICRLF